MIRGLREYMPVFLVPLAWLSVAATQMGYVSSHTLLIAHIVMVVLLTVFAVTGRRDMKTGTLAAWWSIIVAGIPVMLWGVAGLVLDSSGVQVAALSGWILLPALGFIDTGKRTEIRAWIYFAASTGCVVSAFLLLASFLLSSEALVTASVVVVGVSQTAAILDAAGRSR